jgi:predicted secreted protein
MAAVTAAAIKFKVIISGLMTPLPIVVATLSGKIRKARKLNVAASPTAASGERTFVETTVAIELAES